MTRATVPALLLLALVFVGSYVASGAQAPAAPAPAAAAAQQGGGGRGRGGLPGATPEQLQAVAELTAAIAPLTAAVSAARNDLATATFAATNDVKRMASAVEAVRAAELALAVGRSAEFAKLQAGPNRLNADQIDALVAAGGVVAGGRAAAPPAAPALVAPAPAGQPGRGNN